MKLSKTLTTITPFSKTLAMVLFVLLPIVGFYLGMKYQQLGKSEVNMQKTSISNSSETKVLEEKIDLLNTSLNKIISYSKQQKDISTIAQSLDEYKNGFNDFSLVSGKTKLSNLDKTSLEKLNLKIWEDYKLFFETKHLLSSNTSLSAKITEIQEILYTYLKSNISRSLNSILVKPNKKTSMTDSHNFISKFLNFNYQLIQTAQAQTEDAIIHKKVIIDPSSPGTSGGKLLCWRYESWVDLETGNIRQEVDSRFGDKCRTYIYIQSGKTDEQLALDPINKFAEWVKPPKVGVGSDLESKSNPYVEFKTNLEQGVYTLEGTSIYKDKETYKVRRSLYKNDYEDVYLDMNSYLPIAKLAYEEDIVVKTDPDDNTKSEVIRTGNMVNTYNFYFQTAEQINKSSLPSDLFDLTIPQGFELHDFVPFG